MPGAITGPTTPTIGTPFVTTTRTSRTKSIREIIFATGPRIVWTSAGTTARPRFVPAVPAIVRARAVAAYSVPVAAIDPAQAIVQAAAVPPTVLVAVAIGP